MGVVITNDLHWRENTAEIIKKVNKRFYHLCKLRQFGVKREERLKTWNALIRPITEYAAPLWHSGLLECDNCLLENLQKKALGLIFGTTYIDHRRYYRINGKPVSYELALKACELDSLAERRDELTTKFAHDTYNNPMHKDFFEVITGPRPNTRSKPEVQIPFCSTSRYSKSAIPAFTKIINSKSK